MIGVLLNTIFASYLDNLAIEIHERATNDIQSSTCSDTVGEEEILPSNDHFEVFEVRYTWIFFCYGPCRIILYGHSSRKIP